MRLVVVSIIVSIFLVGLVLSDTASTQTNIGNAVPVASSVSVAAGNLVSGDVALVANTTRQINVTATVTDNNGCTEISSVNATFFRTNITGGLGAADNNRRHYSADCTVQSGTCTGEGDLAATYDCAMNFTWYADATDSGSHFAATNWTINVIPHDSSGAGTSASNIYDVRTLTAFTLRKSGINFGALSLGLNTTTTNQNITIENHGNEPIDISLTGYASSSGDNLSMNCTLGTIPIHYLEYSASAFTYGAGVDLTNTSTELDFDLFRGNESVVRPQKLSYFGFGIPTNGVAGSCSGNLVIVATSDPGLD